MNNLVPTMWLCISCFGGLLAATAIPSYLPFALVPIIFGYFAYRELTEAKSRNYLLVTSGLVLVVGIVVGQVFYRNSSLSDIGIIIAMLTFACAMISVQRIWVIEKCRKENKGDGG